MPSFFEVVREDHPYGSMWRVSDLPDMTGFNAVFMKIRAAGVDMIVCVHPGRDNLPQCGATYTSGTRTLEPVNVEVEHADHE